jgi:16S rRNA (uracil1498-N3)-methyltransferase
VRVFVPEASGPGEQLALPAEEAAHVSRVLRLVTGDSLRVFNGRGGEWAATVAQCTRSSVTVSVAGAVTPAPETRVRYTVALALLKGDGTDEAIRDAVMLGAALVRPFVAARGELSMSAALRGHRLDRWRRVAIASAKQCGRAVVPEIAAPVTFGVVAAAAGPALRLLLAEPSASAATMALADVPTPAAVTLAIGPEGGWTPDEVALAVHEGWLLASLGARTLRATSAPLAALAACQAVWRDH